MRFEELDLTVKGYKPKQLYDEMNDAERKVKLATWICECNPAYPVTFYFYFFMGDLKKNVLMARPNCLLYNLTFVLSTISLRAL